MSYYKDEQPRSVNGKYKTFWTTRRKVYGSLLLTLIALTLIAKVGEEYVDGYLKNEITYIAAPRVYAEEIVKPTTIEEMRNDVLDRLAKCENPNKKPIVFDTNGKASVGSYQWQLHSFQYYYEKKTGKKITEWEAAQLALNEEEARALAAYVIFETDKGSSKDWVNCTNWHDLDTLISFIKSHD